VTGASEGLGKAIAITLAKEGANVAISARRDRILAKTHNEIESATKSKALSISGDMTKLVEVEQMVAKVIAEYGTVHILVNNVGRATRAHFSTIDAKTLQDSWDLNLMSAVYVTKVVAPYMQKQRWGRIINIASLSATEPERELVASNVAKSGLLSLSKTLAMEMANDNILVNCISPGLIISPQNNRYFTKAERQEAVSKIPLGRFGTPDEIGDVVTFLCSERASFITGTNIIVDGGTSKRL